MGTIESWSVGRIDHRNFEVFWWLLLFKDRYWVYLVVDAVSGVQKFIFALIVILIRL